MCVIFKNLFAVSCFPLNYLCTFIVFILDYKPEMFSLFIPEFQNLVNARPAVYSQ